MIISEALNNMAECGENTVQIAFVGNTQIEFCGATGRFDVYEERNGEMILKGEFSQEKLLDLYPSQEVEVYMRDKTHPW